MKHEGTTRESRDATNTMAGYLRDTIIIIRRRRIRIIIINKIFQQEAHVTKCGFSEALHKSNVRIKRSQVCSASYLAYPRGCNGL